MLTNRKAADELIKYESVPIHFHAFCHLVSLKKKIISDPVWFMCSTVIYITWEGFVDEGGGLIWF